MSEVLLNVFTSDPAITLYSIAVLVGLGFLIKKYPWLKKYTDIATDLFAYIEDNYKSWGIKGNEKMEFFVKDFIARYNKQFGKVPTQDIIDNAVDLVERLVYEQNKAVKIEAVQATTSGEYKI